MSIKATCDVCGKDITYQKQYGDGTNPVEVHQWVKLNGKDVMVHFKVTDNFNIDICKECAKEAIKKAAKLK